MELGTSYLTITGPLSLDAFPELDVTNGPVAYSQSGACIEVDSERDYIYQRWEEPDG